MKRLLTAMLLSGVLTGPALAQQATLFKDPNCGCCSGHAAYLRQNGIAVTAIDVRDIMAKKREHGVPPQVASCHTALIGGYVVEGHVPMAAIRKLLTEKPDIRGISLPDMPAGSPGMTGAKEAPFEIVTIERDGSSRLFVRD